MAITGMTGAVYVSDVNTAPVSFNDETCVLLMHSENGTRLTIRT
jgi:hypothetical protein